MVYLVGAGPGDPGLITVKALDLIRRADVILYDRLIDPLLLFNAPPDCTLIDVGKSADIHTCPQDEITNLIVKYGRINNVVVRLKGGDPFLFGRGGEEAEKLKEEEIPFEVVPGVTALTAATAYAGIPLTHRDHASSFGVATGHGADDKTSDPVEWEKMACGVDTIVAFMGVGNLEYITGRLLNGGKSPETPAALIERGTTSAQRVVTGTLGSIAETGRNEKVKPPALFIVGKTVSLSEKLGWYHPGPLAGLRIGVTRPLIQSRSFAERLSSLGAEPVFIPTIETTENLSAPEVKKALENIDLYDYVIFSSANGVAAFFHGLEAGNLDARSLSGKIIGVIGPSTGEALLGHGIRADISAGTFVAEGLLDELLASSNVEGKRFLLVRSDIGRNILAEGLRKADALVENTVFYSTRTARLSPYSLGQIRKGALDMITFTSSSTVHGFFSQVKPEELNGDSMIASIGPQTSKAIFQYGKNPDIEAEEYTTEGLANAIVFKISDKVT